MVGKLSLSLVLLPILLACAAPARRGDEGKSGEEQGTAAERVILPPPARAGHMSLEEALARRRSVREFSGKPLSDRELSQLLWAAQGITHPDGFRTVPSAGALYPLEIYVATATGCFHYDPQPHRLHRSTDRDLRPALYRAAQAQEPVREAPAVFVVAAVYERTAKKYGEARSPRYVHLEAGHAAQNLLLEAVALDLGGVPIGAFHDAEIQKVLSLPAEQRPLYLIPIGHAR